MSAEVVTTSAAGVPAPYLQPESRAAADIDKPDREIRFGLIVACLFFIGFLGWAAVARMDAAAYAPGRLVVSGQRQAVQHREGGVVGDILVREGQRVQRGQVLMRLAAADVKAQERALTTQVIGLLAQRARLQAEQLGSGRIQTPPEFAALSAQDRVDAANALRLQQAQLRARASVLNAQRGVLGQRSAQAGQQGVGFSRQVTATTEQLRLISEELASLRGVAEKGFVSQTRIRALERQKAELEGQVGQYAATVAGTRESAGESRLQAVEAERTHLDRVATELREVQTSLNDLLPRLSAARDQLARVEIRAPATGTVVGLTAFTEGGVITPGQKIMDIVPDRAPLLIEARVSPDDADDLRVGQMANVRFDSLHERSLPNLDGRLTRVSADSFVEERTGESYFTAEVVVPHDQLQLIQERRGADFALRAGMPVQVLIPLRKRTALQYFFEPLTGAFWRSFREQ
jgi:HlyD family secretion protein